MHAGDAVLADRDGVAIVPAAVLDSALAQISAAAAAEREEDGDFDLLERVSRGRRRGRHGAASGRADVHAR